MPKDDGDVSFKRVSQGEGENVKHFFVMCTLHEDKDDFERSLLDLEITTDGKSWGAKGLKKPKTPHAEAMQRIHAALRTQQDSEIAYKVQLTEKGEILQVICAWKDQGKEVYQRHQPYELARQLDDGAVTRIFDALLETCQSLQASSSQGSGRMADFKSLAEDSQSLVRDFVKTQGQREEDMLLKFAAVLNEKKKRICQLEKEVKSLMASQGPSQRQGDEKAKKASYSDEDTANTEDGEEDVESGNETDAKEVSTGGQGAAKGADIEKEASDSGQSQSRGKRRKQ